MVFYSRYFPWDGGSGSYRSMTALASLEFAPDHRWNSPGHEIVEEAIAQSSVCGRFRGDMSRPPCTAKPAVSSANFHQARLDKIRSLPEFCPVSFIAIPGMRAYTNQGVCPGTSRFGMVLNVTAQSVTHSSRRTGWAGGDYRDGRRTGGDSERTGPRLEKLFIQRVGHQQPEI